MNSWTNTPINFGETEQPRTRPGRTPIALVLNPIVDGFRLHKVLMEGGNGLNLIYEDTLDIMQFSTSHIEQSHTTF